MRYIKADKIFDGERFLESPSILAYNHQNMLSAILPEPSQEAGNIEQYTGILTPGFVNAHCHLELSHLYGAIPERTGLAGFGKQIISLRNQYNKGNSERSMQDADQQMYQNGIVAVGDISNGGESIVVKKSSKIHYHTFVELLALNPANAAAALHAGEIILNQFEESGLSAGLTPHAPYTCSLDLLQQIKAFNEKRNQPFSIHNQETHEENKFFEGAGSEIYELYSFLNADISFFKPPGKSSLAHIFKDLPHGAILVHNTVTSEKDIALVKPKDPFWCFCPNANLYIENSLPDFAIFRDFLDKQICLGTDSLASNHQLDLISEANVILQNSDVISTEQLLRAICSNAAKALNLHSKYGTLDAGKAAGLNLIEMKENKLIFKKKIL